MVNFKTKTTENHLLK